MNAQTIPRPEVADELVDRAEIKDGTVLVEYSRTEASLQALRERFAGATFDLTTTAGDKAARAARLELVTLRTKLDKTRKEFKAPALEFGRRIDSEAKRIEGEILALEEPIDDQIKADERRREAEKAAKAEAERVRVVTIRNRIDAMHAFVHGVVGKTAEEIAAAQFDLSAIELDDGFAEFAAEADAVKAECAEKLGAMIEAAQAAEAEAARAKAAREAEAARLAAERAEQQRIAAEQAEQARQLAEQRALIEQQARELREAQERLYSLGPNDSRAARFAAAPTFSPLSTTKKAPMTETTITKAAIAAILFSALPPIGQPLDCGTFHGITTDRTGAHFAVVLIDAKPDEHLTWKGATAWAESVGGQLPTRPVAALLYANAKPLLQPAWHWTSDTLDVDTGDADDASYAWLCNFDGYQDCIHKSASGAAVAVRLIPLGA